MPICLKKYVVKGKGGGEKKKKAFMSITYL